MTEPPQKGDAYQETTGWRRTWIVIGGKTDSQGYYHVKLLEPHTGDRKTLALSAVRDRSRFVAEPRTGPRPS